MFIQQKNSFILLRPYKSCHDDSHFQVTKDERSSPSHRNIIAQNCRVEHVPEITVQVDRCDKHSSPKNNPYSLCLPTVIDERTPLFHIIPMQTGWDMGRNKCCPKKNVKATPKLGGGLSTQIGDDQRASASLPCGTSGCFHAILALAREPRIVTWSVRRTYVRTYGDT
jgi:hypothetical protein